MPTEDDPLEENVEAILGFLEDPDAPEVVKQLALRGVAASVGSCAICGSPLQYEGHATGLRVCCRGREKHCWLMSGEMMPGG
jgi:hypothetical protein